MEASEIMPFSLYWLALQIGTTVSFFAVWRHSPNCEDALRITPQEISFRDLKAVPKLVHCVGNQQRMFAGKCRVWILPGLPKASVSVNFIFTSPNIILLVKFIDKFHVRKLKIIFSHELVEPHPSSCQLLSCVQH